MRGVHAPSLSSSKVRLAPLPAITTKKRLRSRLVHNPTFASSACLKSSTTAGATSPSFQVCGVAHASFGFGPPGVLPGGRMVLLGASRDGERAWAARYGIRPTGASGGRLV